ncbi:MAG: glycerol-3-phosphate acyltransferase, partial [Oscillospiraceae bacterium]|nr:glycerol-3-phosphate acyltransferase [Oscillospiraceae bacterium]
MRTLLLIIIAIVAYFCGGLNGAIISSRFIFHDDVRKHGSGNAGLTNFHRTYGTKGAAMVIAIDVLKSVIAVLVGGWLLKPFGYGAEGAVLGAVAVSLGHDFPALLGFKGGKGIVCGLA